MVNTFGCLLVACGLCAIRRCGTRALRGSAVRLSQPAPLLANPAVVWTRLQWVNVPGPLGQPRGGDFLTRVEQGQGWPSPAALQKLICGCPVWGLV
eukprot:6491005-Prymnesium_polylepis.1